MQPPDTIEFTIMPCGPGWLAAACRTGPILRVHLTANRPPPPQERSKQQQARWRKALLPTPSQRPNAMKAAQAPEQPPPAADIWQD